MKRRKIGSLSTGIYSSPFSARANLSNQPEMETDQELLSRYVNCKDPVAIEQLIVRHAPMVAAVCRTTTNCRPDAEDAFQATFLVLLSSAAKIQRQSSVVAWLHGVAYRIASRTRARRRRERLLLESANVSALEPYPHQSSEEPLVVLARKVELELLFREMEQLPERVSSTLVEHYLYGFSAREISERMDVSVSAVEGRLRRGRRMLRSRLIRRGLSLSVALGSLSYLKKQLLANEAQQWYSRFTEDYLTNLDSGIVSKSDSSDVQSLVQGELSMLNKTLVTKTAAGVLAFGMLGSLVAWGLWVDDGSLASQSSAGQTIVLQESSPTAPALLELAEAIAITSPAAAENEAAAPQEHLAQIDSSTRDQEKSSDKSESAELERGPVELYQPPAPVTWTRGENLPAWLETGSWASAIEQRIEANRQKLHEVVPGMEYTDVPLSQVASDLSEQVGVFFTLDNAELEIEGIDPDTPVSITLPECSLSEALDLILTPLNLTYRIRESGIQITSFPAVEERGALRAYDLSYLLSTSEHASAIIKTIQESIDPDSWPVNGGQSNISMIGSILFITCPERTHQDIEKFLRMLSTMNLDNSSPPGIE